VRSSSLHPLYRLTTVNPDEADYVELAGSGLLIAGSSVILPSLGVLAINAVGFTSTGVAAGIQIDHYHNIFPR
jgi:hypothetical protein